jgi:hypothetical protein
MALPMSVLKTLTAEAWNRRRNTQWAYPVATELRFWPIHGSLVYATACRDSRGPGHNERACQIAHRMDASPEPGPVVKRHWSWGGMRMQGFRSSSSSRWPGLVRQPVIATRPPSECREINHQAVAPGEVSCRPRGCPRRRADRRSRGPGAGRLTWFGVVTRPVAGVLD